ncbi:MAG: N-6 DNA methylase, partial [Bacteroidetes bacterium]|nr:N-6 DNA methylase [Bacteroidota bacterium]
MVRKKTKIKQLEVAIPEIIGEVTTSVIEALTNWISLETIYKAQERGLLAFHENKVKYIIQNKTYRVTDPEEAVRIAFYLELIDRYQYPPERINFEVEVPGRTPDVQADIVVFEDDAHKKPYIVVECKKDGISPAELAQAEKQAIGNANALRSKYCILVAGTIRIARDIAGFAQDEREKNIIADIPIRYGKVIKFKYKKGDEPWELKDVTKDELLAKFQQCHDALWEGGRRNPAEAFDEMSKLMYCKIQDERFLTKKGEHYRFQVGTHETVNEVGERIKDIYKDAQKIDKEVFTEPIKTDNPIIYTVAEILQGISLARTDLDVKGEGYEHFLGGVFRGAMGQYFTPRPIVAFMVDFIEPIVSDLIIDPACGSGGFLIHTLEKMRKELHAKLDEKDADYRWQDFALKQVYGIEINSQLARVAMMNMIIHEDGHTNIENADALDNSETWKRQKIREYLGKDFSLLLTNPPFGASVKEREKAYLANYELGGKIKKRNRQNTEILFIERCLDFLKPGGRMGIVLPDGILSNSSLQYVRDFITERAQILGIVSLPQTAFKRPSSKGSGDSGSGVKASLLFLRKKRERETLPKDYPIFMAIAEHIGYDATGRPDKDEFPDILKAWQEFRKTNKVDFFVK